MKVKLASVFVDDQEEALEFYTGVLGFVKKADQMVGTARWLTVVSPEAPDEVELSLEPSDNPATRAFKDALYEDNIQWTAFAVADIQAEYERLRGMGVRFTLPPTDVGPVVMAVFDDTCGNLIQLYQAE